MSGNISVDGESISFFSDGVQLRGALYLPASAPPPVPVVVFCDGWGGGRSSVAPLFARGLTERGFAALTFDFRGWGGSDGIRDRLFPLEQAADIEAAVAYVSTRPEVLRPRVAALGILTGAAAAFEAASTCDAIGAVIGLFPFGDGSRWLRSLRRNWEWREFLALLAADRARRCLKGESELVDPNVVLVRDPESLERNLADRGSSRARNAWRLGLDSADAIVRFKPEDHVHRIAARAVMCVALENDGILPLEEVQLLYERLREPKRLVVLRGLGHYDAYRAEVLEPLLDTVTKFMEKHLL